MVPGQNGTMRVIENKKIHKWKQKIIITMLFFPYLFDFSFHAEDHKTNGFFQYFIYTEKTNKILTRFFYFSWITKWTDDTQTYSNLFIYITLNNILQS